MRKSLNLTDLSSLHSNWGEACKDSVNWQDIMMENRQTCINIRTNHENKGKSVIKRRCQVAHFRFTCAHMRLLNVGALLVHCKSSNEGLCLRYRVSWRRTGGWFSSIVWRQAKRYSSSTAEIDIIVMFGECGLKGSGLKKFSDGATDSG